MSVYAITDVKKTIRGIIVDQEVPGEDVLFSDDEIITALNMAKSGMFARKPSVFSISKSSSNILTLEEPSDYTTSTTNIDIAKWGLEPLCYYTAAICLLQKSKDAYYREAADKLIQLYEGTL